MRGAIVVASLLIAVGRHVAAQATPLLPGDRDASDQLSKIVESTRQSGLPVDPILARVHYGLVVAHAPAPRIVAAARAVASRLPVARDALAPGATARDIVAGEDALSNGATTDALKAIRAASGNQSVAVALGVLAQLVASGVSVQRASETVVALVKRGASAQQLATLGNEVNLDIATGVQAASSLDMRARGLTAVLAPPGAVTGPGLTTIAAPTGNGKKP